MIKKLSVLIGIASFLILSGCNKLTQDNYSKVKIGMDRPAVEKLFGKPKNCQNVMMAMNCTWEEDDASLHIQFIDNKVATYFGNKIK